MNSLRSLRLLCGLCVNSFISLQETYYIYTMTENEISYKVIGAVIKIHKQIGPGLLESAYENALSYDLKSLGLEVEQQVPMPFKY